MESLGERELGVLGMDEELLESMVQDESPEQEMLVVQDELPQLNPEPEMGAAAAAEYDTPPPHLRQSPSPTPGESTPDGKAIAADPPNVGQLLMALLAQMNEMKEEINGIKKGMEANTNGMREEMKEMRGEMRQMGRCLQAGIMATPRAGTNELGGSATVVRPAVGRVKTK